MIRESLMFAKQPFGSKEEVISFAAEHAGREGLLTDKEAFVRAVYQREEEISTSLGHGMAIPHGKTDAVKEPFISFISTEKPFIWDDKMSDDVEAIFLIGVPKTNAETLHLKAIAAISKRLMDASFRKKLYECRTSREVYELLREMDQNIKDA